LSRWAAALLVLAGWAARAQNVSLDAGTPDASGEEAVQGRPGTGYSTVVTAPRALSRDRTQDATQVSGQTLRDSTRETTFEALSQESAGIYVPGHGALHGIGNGATGGVHIRGLGGTPNTQVLVVEDGVPDYQGIFGHPIPDAYVPFLIDEVLVVKGGDSVLFGTNAMAGVVVIRNRWRMDEGVEVLNDSSLGSYSTLRESASTLAHLGAWDLAGGIQALTTAGHRPGAGGSSVVGSAAIRYSFSPEWKLTLRNKVLHLEGNDPGPETHPTLDHTYEAWRDTASVQLAWTHDAVRATTTAYLNVGVHQLYDGFHSTDWVGGGISELEWRPSRRAELLVGLAAEHVNGEVDNRVTGVVSPVTGLTDASAYGQLTLRPLERLSMVVGGRALASTRYGTVPLYKVGLLWSPGGGVYFHSRVARNFRQPTIRELYLPFPTANPDLRPEYALNWDAGAGWASEHLDLSVTGFRTAADDLIRYFGVWPSAEVVNIDRVVIWGVEARVAVRALGPLSAAVSGVWQDVGRYTRQNPDAKANFAIDLGQDFGPHFLGASVTGEWVHGLYMADYGEQRIPNVFVMDLALRYRYASAERRLSVEPYVLLRNFLDRRYAYVEGYPMPGFNVLLGLRIGL